MFLFLYLAHLRRRHRCNDTQQRARLVLVHVNTYGLSEIKTIETYLLSSNATLSCFITEWLSWSHSQKVAMEITLQQCIFLNVAHFALVSPRGGFLVFLLGDSQKQKILT